MDQATCAVYHFIEWQKYIYQWQRCEGETDHDLLLQFPIRSKKKKKKQHLKWGIVLYWPQSVSSHRENVQYARLPVQPWSSWTCVIREQRISTCKPWVKLIVKSNHPALHFWPQLQKKAIINIQTKHEIFCLLQCSLCWNWQKHEQPAHLAIKDWETSYCIGANSTLHQTRKLGSCIIHPWMIPWAIVELSDWGPKCKSIIY